MNNKTLFVFYHFNPNFNQQALQIFLQLITCTDYIIRSKTRYVFSINDNKFITKISI